MFGQDGVIFQTILTDSGRAEEVGRSTKTKFITAITAFIPYVSTFFGTVCGPDEAAESIRGFWISLSFSNIPIGRDHHSPIERNNPPSFAFIVSPP